jgi:hypothetical protein
MWKSAKHKLMRKLFLLVILTASLGVAISAPSGKVTHMPCCSSCDACYANCDANNPTPACYNTCYNMCRHGCSFECRW